MSTSEVIIFFIDLCEIFLLFSLTSCCSCVSLFFYQGPFLRDKAYTNIYRENYCLFFSFPPLHLLLLLFQVISRNIPVLGSSSASLALYLFIRLSLYPIFSMFTYRIDIDSRSVFPLFLFMWLTTSAAAASELSVAVGQRRKMRRMASPRRNNYDQTAKANREGMDERRREERAKVGKFVNCEIDTKEDDNTFVNIIFKRYFIWYRYANDRVFMAMCVVRHRYFWVFWGKEEKVEKRWKEESRLNIFENGLKKIVWWKNM